MGWHENKKAAAHVPATAYNYSYTNNDGELL